MMRVYYDNVITSGLVTGDISPESEREALAEIEVAHEAGFVKRVTSRESWREQERTRDANRRAQLQSARDLVSVVQADHRVLGFATLNGPLGTVATNPLVSDIVDGVRRALERCSGYHVWNLGGSRTIRLRDLIEKIASGLGVAANIEELPMQPGDVARTWADVSLAQDELDWTPTVDIDQGLEAFLRWFEEQRRLT